MQPTGKQWRAPNTHRHAHCTYVVPVAGAAGRMKSQVLPAVTLHVYTPPLFAAFRVTVWVRGPAPALVDPVTTGRTVAGPATVMSEDTDTAALEATLCSTDNPLLITAALLTGTCQRRAALTSLMVIGGALHHPA